MCTAADPTGRQRPGATCWAYAGKAYQPGDSIELTPEQAGHFKGHLTVPDTTAPE